MPRRPRVYLPGVPAHIVQRGNNRDACFFSDDDYLVYRECLSDACRRYGVALYAYVLMTNHVHLLMTPERADGVSRAMQSIGRRYVQYVNRKYRRTGTLFEGRHKESLIDEEDYLLTCFRYIELNPVRASMVIHPGDYRWSSYRAHAYGAREDAGILSTHERYQALGRDAAERQHAYRDLFSVALEAEDVHRVRTAVNFSTPLGNERFLRQIEKVTGHAIGRAGRGRPRRRVRD